MKRLVLWTLCFGLTAPGFSADGDPSKGRRDGDVRRSPVKHPKQAPPAYEAKNAIYRFAAEQIEGRTLEPRLPFKRFRYRQPLLISSPDRGRPSSRH